MEPPKCVDHYYSGYLHLSFGCDLWVAYRNLTPINVISLFVSVINNSTVVIGFNTFCIKEISETKLLHHKRIDWKA